ncbi:MAG: acetate/propionate family kinase [Candidatus Vogelbacteria bacterium]|nr:acetate/propionate family kinase [Candidatus Vogelbacteria bacterium]
MDKKYLIVNTGSASHKYALYKGSVELANFNFEKRELDLITDIAPVEFLLKTLISKKLIIDAEEIALVCFRIVAPGEYFIENNIIGDEYLSNLKKVEKEAPLHIAPLLDEICAVQKFFPLARLLGVSDSFFHKSLPDVTRRYAVPEADYLSGVKRYGYHGISVASVLRKVESWLGSIPDKIVVCHLGSGSSITAVKGGESIDTSMGLTPLEGVPMGSRVGNIDPGALIYLGEKKGLGYKDLEKYLNEECGVLGLSGKTKDMRDLIELERGGDKNAKLALNSYSYGVKKYIGAYIASLNGLDLLVFTAAIGERSSIMRGRILSNLSGLGIILDREKNDATTSRDGFIHSEKSPVKIAVINTNEMGEMAKEVLQIEGRELLRKS